MLDFFRHHPFAVVSHFDTSLVLTYAVSKDQLEKFIPKCLALDTFEDKWAFIAVAIVKVHHLRPKGLPKFLGHDFVLIGYRIFVQYNTSYNKRLRGLYIIRSETDKKKMTFLGNIFTHYNYLTTDIRFQYKNGFIDVYSSKSNLSVKIEEGNTDAMLPKQSPFYNYKDARRYSGPLPFTFTYNHTNKKVLMIEGVREGWTPKAVDVIEDRVGFLDTLQLHEPVLANAFLINDIPYHWRKGKKDPWTEQ